VRLPDDSGELRAHAAEAGPWARLAALVGAVALVVALAAGIAASAGSDPAPVGLGAPLADDPFAYEPDRRGEFEARASAGLAHVLYANSPGGVVETARRTARFRDRIEAATAGTGTDPDLLEAIVFLESAGRPEVIAGPDPEAAAGLTQIVASTGLDLLGMNIDLERSRELTRKINRAYRLGDYERAERLRAERISVDERFDARTALEGAVRYLQIARRRFGADDLAVVSYHMGIGNLEEVIGTYLSEEPDPGGEPVPYAELYFNSSPIDHPETWNLLASFGDESSEYFWKVLAAQGIMRLYREDPVELRRLAQLHGAKATAEEVFHPPDRTEAFDDPGELEDAWQAGGIVPITESVDVGYVLDEGLGRLASEVDSDPALYRGLRPEALTGLTYLAGRVREVNGGAGSLIVTSAVRDRAYQDLLGERNPQAADAYSLHTTGWSFDIARRYESDAQGGAFQFVLDRLQALALIDYAVEPDVIHITVSPEVGPLIQ
jgi:soluble lytic murein transglycosylase-like protein